MDSSSTSGSISPVSTLRIHLPSFLEDMIRWLSVATVAFQLASAAVFQPTLVKPTSISPYRSASHGTGTGTLYAVAAEGYTDGPIVVAELAGMWVGADGCGLGRWEVDARRPCLLLRYAL